MTVYPAIPNPNDRKARAMAQTIIDCSALSEYEPILTIARMAIDGEIPSKDITRQFEVSLSATVPPAYHSVVYGFSDDEKATFNALIASYVYVFHFEGGVG